MIKGVGNYNDFELVEQRWDENTGSDCYQIHAHRNTKNVPIHASDRNYNLEGRVEFGGDLRAVRLNKDGSVDEFCIKNTVYKAQEETAKEYERNNEEAKSVGDMIIAMRNNKYIQEKQFGNISSFNFTKAAFNNDVWDDMTTKARGLYINIPKEKIICRGYDKFWSINELCKNPRLLGL